MSTFATSMQCTVCNKIFTNSSAAAKHKLTHSLERKYVCSICGKAFKRQDHLNGHKMTHQVNKPHACKLCDKSFTDHRSLRRHYCKQHSEYLKHLDQQKTDYASFESKLDAEYAVGESLENRLLINPFAEPNNVFCSICCKGFKSQAALNGHMRCHGGYQVVSNQTCSPVCTKNDNTNQPTLTTAGDEVAVKPVTLNFAYAKNLWLDGGSERNKLKVVETTNTPLLDSVAPLYSTSYDSTESNQSNQQIYPSKNANVSSKHVDSSVEQLTKTDERMLPSSMNRHFTVTKNSSDGSNTFSYSNIDGFQTLNNTLLASDSDGQFNMTDIFTFEPAHIDLGLELAAQHSQNTFPSILMVDDEAVQKNAVNSQLLRNPISSRQCCSESDNSSLSNSCRDSLRTSMETKDGLGTFQNDSLHGMLCGDAFSNSECSSSIKNTKRKPEPLLISPNCNAIFSRLRLPQYVALSENGAGTRFVARISGYDAVKKLPYTPPPMLSPTREGVGLFSNFFFNRDVGKGKYLKHCGPTTCNSARRWPQMSVQVLNRPKSANLPVLYTDDMSTISNMADSASMFFDSGYQGSTCSSSKSSMMSQENVEDSTCGLPSSAHPTINKGKLYQATLPEYQTTLSYSNDDSLYETLLWHPNLLVENEETETNLNMLLRVAGSSVARDCGLNAEHAYRLIYHYSGDLVQALKHLLQQSLSAFGYIYSETTSWNTSEIELFQTLLQSYDRDFFLVSRDLRASGFEKSVKECVEFYYVWKRMNLLDTAYKSAGLTVYM